VVWWLDLRENKANSASNKSWCLSLSELDNIFLEHPEALPRHSLLCLIIILTISCQQELEQEEKMVQEMMAVIS